MAKVKIDKLVVRMRGVSRTEARRVVADLAPAVERALAAGSAPITSRASIAAPALPRPAGTLADRIAAPIARGLRGGSR